MTADFMATCEQDPRAPLSAAPTDTDADDSGHGSRLIGRPGRLEGPFVWAGTDFQAAQDYTLELCEGDIEELDHALAFFLDLGLDGDEVDRHNFPLPTLHRKLEQCAEILHEGRGFSVVRGLQPDRYTVEDGTVLFLGIAAYIGDERGLQDKKGNMLSHITDSKLWTVPRERRHGIHSNQSLPFHNDMGADILALQVRQCATEGGRTYVASSWTIYNDLMIRDPAAVAELFKPEWPIQISARHKRQARHVLAPLLTFHGGRLVISVDPKRLGPQTKKDSEDVPSLTPAQNRALEALRESAWRNQFSIQAAAGDLLFINNWALLHRRDSYSDDENTSRHLVRLWLRNSKLGWPVPKAMAIPWLAAFGDNTGVLQRLYPIFPMPEYTAPKYSAGSAAFVLEDSDEEGA